MNCAFKAGDVAKLFLPAIPDRHLERVTVAAGFGVHRVAGIGERVGYIVEFDGRKCFAPAWMLRDEARKPCHLRLIHKREGL